MRGSCDPPKDGQPLSDRGMEVVVIGDGGGPEARVMLRCGVSPIAVAGSLGDAGVLVVSEFGCFLILALHTAHYLLSVDNRRKKKNIRVVKMKLADLSKKSQRNRMTAQ